MKCDGDQLLADARSGDPAAIRAHLDQCKVDPGVVQKVDAALKALTRGRSRDESGYEARVAARMHYVRGRSLSVPKDQLVEEMTERFGIKGNVAMHLAEGRGYAEERAEAERRLRAEADPQ
ncbi:hypothetical protein [Bradyrhizobium sp. S3.2.12]|uniref:hypothetical protein n=1 Tax=Bradyrhizobium sp. S3.2.12 TaxID=3156387 RepID=UPI00339679D7